MTTVRQGLYAAGEYGTANNKAIESQRLTQLVINNRLSASIGRGCHQKALRDGVVSGHDEPLCLYFGQCAMRWEKDGGTYRQALFSKEVGIALQLWLINERLAFELLLNGHVRFHDA